MSWVFAVISRNPISSELIDQFKAIHTRAKFIFEQTNVYIASAGPELTTCCHIDYPEKEAGYIALGSPLWAINGEYHFLGKDEWDSFSWEENDIQRLESHYSLLRWDGSYIQCWTDPIGLRDFLVVETGWGYVITTRLDWATQMLGEKSFHKEALATHIITGASLGQDMIVKGIKRINRGMKANITPSDCLLLQASNHKSATTIHSRDELYNDMMKRVLLPYKENRRLAVALSGGIDSRTVISFLLHPQAKQYHQMWDAFTIGSPIEADVKSAVQITKEMNIRHTIYEPDLLPLPELWNYMKENTLAMRMDLFPATTNRYRFVYDLAKKYDGVIDGGGTWLLRYNELRELGLRHHKDIMTGKWDMILPHLVRNTSFIFKKEVQDEMHHDMQSKTIKMLSGIQNPSDIGFYNWLNLLYTELWLPYFYSSHQIWTDNIYHDYMPNMSHIFMQNALQIPQEQKLDNQLCYYFIKKNRERLLHIPRTAYALQLPCQTNTTLWAIYARIHHKLIPKTTKNYDVSLWNHLKEPVLDRLYSTAVKQYDGYDWISIRNHVEAFYAGKTEYANWIDHWLRFDFWRELVTK
jgi:hypothetical protein